MGIRMTVAEYSVWIDFSSEDNAKDDFMQQMKLFIDENNISSSSATSDSNIPETLLNMEKSTNTESVQDNEVLEVVQEMEKSFSNGDHDNLLDYLSKIHNACTHHNANTLMDVPDYYSHLPNGVQHFLQTGIVLIFHLPHILILMMKKFLHKWTLNYIILANCWK